MEHSLSITIQEKSPSFRPRGTFFTTIELLNKQVWFVASFPSRPCILSSLDPDTWIFIHALKNLIESFCSSWTGDANDGKYPLLEKDK